MVEVGSSGCPRITKSKDNKIWGYSSVGRAIAWHAIGRRFKSVYLHCLTGWLNAGAGYGYMAIRGEGM